MKLYEIDQAIMALLEGGVDPETGEVTVDTEALQALQMERDHKLESVALAVKNLAAEGKAIREEEVALAKRRKAKETQAERLRGWLISVLLDSHGVETARVRLSVRQGAQKPDINEDEFLPWALENGEDLLRYKEPEIDRRKVLDALKNGAELPGCSLVREPSLIIR